MSTDEGLQVDIQHYLTSDAKAKAEANGKNRAHATPDDMEANNMETADLDGKIRWLRVNEIKWSIAQATTWLEQQGWTWKHTLSEVVVKGRGRSFCIDEHIPNLVAFPAHSLHLPSFQPYRDARLIAQDKASCIPAYLLLQDRPIDVDTVIDATSAPGNKTSYVAAVLSTSGSAATVYAFERNKPRYETLGKMMQKAACSSTFSSRPSGQCYPQCRLTDRRM